jgi:hypothetical protein
MTAARVESRRIGGTGGGGRRSGAFEERAHDVGEEPQH